MGYYIETPTPLRKAQQLEAVYDAVIVPRPEGWGDVPKDKALICVLQNGPFDAAGLCYDEREFEAFRRPHTGCQRTRTWLLMDRALAYSLAGYEERNRASGQRREVEVLGLIAAGKSNKDIAAALVSASGRPRGCWLLS